jgi:hypothetical protein
MILKSDADRRVKKQADETVQECGKVFDGSTQKSTDKAIYHARTHLENLFPSQDGALVKCTFGECHDSLSPFESQYYTEHVQHLFLTHHIRVEGYRGKTPEVQFTHMFWWCPFCQRFVLQQEEDINRHIVDHIPAYDEAFRSRGYYAITQDHLTVWPTLCPICVRDRRKSLVQRFTPVYEMVKHAGKDLWRHLHCHYHSPDPSSFVVPCPLSVSTPDGITATCALTSIPVGEVSQHLLEAHGWDLKQGLELQNQEQGRNSKKKRAAKEDPMPAGEQREGQRIVLGNIDTNTDISPRKPVAKKRRV